MRDPDPSRDLPSIWTAGAAIDIAVIEAGRATRNDLPVCTESDGQLVVPARAWRVT